MRWWPQAGLGCNTWQLALTHPARAGCCPAGWPLASTPSRSPCWRCNRARCAPGPGPLRAPPRPACADWQLRLIDLRTESDALLHLQCLDSAPFETAGYREFRRLQLLRHAQLARLGLGAWFGLWCNGTLAAQCGLMRQADRPGALGRFQQVSTHPAWRRRGLCTALVHGVSEWGFSQWQLAQAVLCADPHGAAIGIYRSLGYQPASELWQLQRNAAQDTATHTSVSTPQIDV